MADNKIDLVLVVNGQATEVQGAPNAPLHTVIPRALEQTGNVGQPPGNWELRNVAGALLDVDQKIETYRFDQGTKLFLNLKAGIGGNATSGC